MLDQAGCQKGRDQEEGSHGPQEDPLGDDVICAHQQVGRPGVVGALDQVAAAVPP